MPSGFASGQNRRILVINVNWLGDVIFSTPFFRALRDAYPKAHIASLLHPRCVEILEGNPCVDEIMTYDEEGLHKSIFGKILLMLALKNKKFDTAFILHRSFTKALLALTAGIPERIGYPTKARGYLLTHTVAQPEEEMHKVEYFLNIARSRGIAVHGIKYEFYIDESDREFADNFLVQNGVGKGELLIAICPGGNWDPKRWPKENFAALADKFVGRFGGKVIITGGKPEVELAREIASMMKVRPIIAAGMTSLKQLGAIFKRCGLVVANDTGTMHISVAVGANTIALFGPTSPKLTGPYGEGNYKVISKNDECSRPCYDMSCHDNSCMKKIAVEDVMREAQGFLLPRGAGRIL